VSLVELTAVRTARILVAEDSLVVRAVVREQLEEQGYDVVEAEDGEAALNQAFAARPDAILLDIEMPGMNGYEVLTRLKTDPDLADIPVVFLTGHTTTADMVEGLRAGAHDYLKKPFEPAELMARIAGAVRIKRLQDELRLRNSELDLLSRIDGLTGLHNRRHIDETLEKAGASALRHGQVLSVLILDIDHFKHVNDTYGHPGGDLVLVEFARRLRLVARTNDVVGRWGGEEFVIIAPQTDLEGALALGERARADIAADTIQVGDEQVAVTVSVGCASGVEPAASLVAKADAALYRSKTSGRNRVTGTDDTNDTDDRDETADPPG
jgi:diguanylate cyclase (GGDEF)-like protein